MRACVSSSKRTIAASTRRRLSGGARRSRSTAERKRGITNKKVQNRRLKMELGYQFKYPNFRKGYTAEIQRLDQAGKLNIELEPR